MVGKFLKGLIMESHDITKTILPPQAHVPNSVPVKTTSSPFADMRKPGPRQPTPVASRPAMCITFSTLSLEVPQTPRRVWLGACQACCPRTGSFGSQEAGHCNSFFRFSRSRSRSQQGPHSIQRANPSQHHVWHVAFQLHF